LKFNENDIKISNDGNKKSRETTLKTETDKSVREIVSDKTEEIEYDIKDNFSNQTDLNVHRAKRTKDK